jgi:hypothetical protein
VRPFPRAAARNEKERDEGREILTDIPEKKANEVEGKVCSEERK